MIARILLCMAMMLVLPESSSTQTSTPSDSHANLEVLRTLASRIGELIGKSVSLPDTISLVVYPQERAWYFEGALARGIARSGHVVISSLSGSYTAEIGIAASRILYENPRRDGFLGARVVEREVRLTLSAKLVRSGGEILLLRELQQESRDTIDLSALAQLENPSIPMTQGVPPREGFFDTIAEPIIILGSIAVAVFLLFHIRS